MQVFEQPRGLIIGYFTMSYKIQTKRKGFTLAEAMIATVVLGIAAAGLLLPFTSGAAVRVEGMRRTLGAKLAADLMEEIISYAKFSRNVSCEYVYVPQESGTGKLKFIRVTVRVYYSGKQIAIINRLISE